MHQLLRRLVKKTKLWSKSVWIQRLQRSAKFLNKGRTKNRLNSINRLLVKFRTVDRHPGSGRRSARTDDNVDTVESLLQSQKTNHRATEQPEKFNVRRRSIDHLFRRLFTKFCVSSATRKGALNSWLKRTACTRYFQYAVWETITW